MIENEERVKNKMKTILVESIKWKGGRFLVDRGKEKGES
jgi:hypothetical protein